MALHAVSITRHIRRVGVAVTWSDVNDSSACCRLIADLLARLAHAQAIGRVRG
jgi:hypothetical protein